MNEENKILGNTKTLEAMSKLKRDKLDIEINSKKFLLDYSTAELAKLEGHSVNDLSPEAKALYDQTVKTYKDNIANYKESKLIATLVPLKYRDLQAIKDGILEAVKFGVQFDWTEDIRMRAMIREEHTLTVYLALRKRDNLQERYYANLEEIVKEPDSAIDEIYNLYTSNFVLTEEERKNS